MCLLAHVWRSVRFEPVSKVAHRVGRGPVWQRHPQAWLPLFGRTVVLPNPRTRNLRTLAACCAVVINAALEQYSDRRQVDRLPVGLLQANLAGEELGGCSARRSFTLRSPEVHHERRRIPWRREAAVGFSSPLDLALRTFVEWVASLLTGVAQVSSVVASRQVDVEAGLPVAVDVLVVGAFSNVDPEWDRRGMAILWNHRATELSELRATCTELSPYLSLIHI